MRKEIKNSLPLYKIAYAVCFIVILSLVRGITATYEIGIASEAAMAILAAVFCADTYVQEINSKRSEVWRLYPLKKRAGSVLQRLLIQEVFLFLLAILGYGLFFIFQNPPQRCEKEALQFIVYLTAIIITLVFWGFLSNTISCIFRNMWVGMGVCLILWLITNSSAGDRYLGSWNLFSYTFRDIGNSSDHNWLCGKIFCIVCIIIMYAMLPGILRKRG